MRHNSWGQGPLRIIEVTGEGREITVGQRTMRTVVRAVLLIGPEDRIFSACITPIALIVAGPEEEYALSMNGAPIDLRSLRKSIS